uniref:Uncharacterized protein n=1 Tax=Solanum tuberosum TaxID=4113 RepID=M1ALB6_SOLTU
MPTIPKNSIDHEKENKQTNPSAHASINLGKGRGQGITNSTLFTSQGMPTIPKNSIDLEKENKQTNPSAHASTNLGKGKGQGPKCSTFLTSQRMGMKHNNNMASESEAQLEEIVQEDPSLSSIEIVEKCYGPQTRSHVFGFGGVE